MSTKTEIRRAGLLSDLHSLFRYGLVPPSYWPAGRDRVDFTFKFYRYLYECWEHFVENCPPLETLILNGDTLHGEDRKDRAVNVISSDMMEQAAAAKELLTPLRDKAEKLWMFKGTPYHESVSHEALEWLAKELGAKEWSPNRHVGYSAVLEFHGLKIDVAHHQTSGWLYAAGGADRTALLQQAGVPEGKTEQVDMIVRSHLHQKGIVKRHGIWVVQTPGWTVVYPWLEKVSERSRARKQNDIGAIVLETTGNGDMGFREFDYKPFREQVRKA